MAIIPFHSCGNPDSSGTRVYTTLMLSTKDNTTFDNRTKTLELNSLKERKDWALFSFPWELLKSSCFLLSLLESLFSLLHTQSCLSIVALQKQGSHIWIQMCIVLYHHVKLAQKLCILIFEKQFWVYLQKNSMYFEHFCISWYPWGTLPFGV